MLEVCVRERESYVITSCSFPYTGVEVLDSLVELDVCENLISKHSNLAPLLNLHHLNLVSKQDSHYNNMI